MSFRPDLLSYDDRRLKSVRRRDAPKFLAAHRPTGMASELIYAYVDELDAYGHPDHEAAEWILAASSVDPMSAEKARRNAVAIVVHQVQMEVYDESRTRPNRARTRERADV